jgi:chemotaxis protein MotB
MEQLKDDIQGHPDLKQMTNVAIAEDGLVITFGSEHLFDAGSVDIRPDVLETLEIMIDLILQKNPGFRVIVEGHTDNLGLGKGSRFKNNWELSAARASSIIQQFELFGFKKSNLVAIGYSDARPVAPNQDENGVNNFENMGLNRRAVIKVLEPMNDKANKRLGLGAFFNDQEVFPEEETPKMERLQQETRN